MSQVHGNPDEIRVFARNLGLFCDDFRGRLDALESQLRGMGDASWSDQRYHEFTDVLARCAQSIRLALDELEPEQVQRLSALANLLDEYEQT